MTALALNLFSFFKKIDRSFRSTLDETLSVFVQVILNIVYGRLFAVGFALAFVAVYLFLDVFSNPPTTLNEIVMFILYTAGSIFVVTVSCFVISMERSIELCKIIEKPFDYLNKRMLTKSFLDCLIKTVVATLSTFFVLFVCLIAVFILSKSYDYFFGVDDLVVSDKSAPSIFDLFFSFYTIAFTFLIYCRFFFVANLNILRAFANKSQIVSFSIFFAIVANLLKNTGVNMDILIALFTAFFCVYTTIVDSGIIRLRDGKLAVTSERFKSIKMASE